MNFLFQAKIAPYYLTVLLCIVFLSGCEKNSVQSEGLVQINSQEVERLVEGKENGFFFAVSDMEESFLPVLEKNLENSNVKVNYYFTYQPDGKATSHSDKQVFNFSNELKKNRLYYIENGNVSEPLRLSSYHNGDLINEINKFIEAYTN